MASTGKKKFDVDKKKLYIIGGVVLGLILLFGVLYFATDLFRPEEETFEAKRGITPPAAPSKPGTSTNMSECKDTDGGNERFKNGSIYHVVSFNGGELKEATNYTDYCSDRVTLLEYYCKYNKKTKKKEVANETIDCEASCKDGECTSLKVSLPEMNSTEIIEESGEVRTLPFVSVVVSETLKMNISATRLDGKNITLVYQIITPDWLPIDNETGRIEWRANESRIGNNSVEVEVSSGNASVNKEFILEVKAKEGELKAVCGDGTLEEDKGEVCETNDTVSCSEYIGANCNGTVTCGAPDVCTWDASACTCTCDESAKPGPEDWSECKEGEQTRKVAECDTSTGQWRKTGTEMRDCETGEGLAWLTWLLIILGGVLLLGGGFFALWYFYLGPNDMLLGSKYDDWFGGGYSSLKTPSPPGGNVGVSGSSGRAKASGKRGPSKTKTSGKSRTSKKASEEELSEYLEEGE